MTKALWYHIKMPLMLKSCCNFLYQGSDGVIAPSIFLSPSYFILTIIPHPHYFVKEYRCLYAVCTSQARRSSSKLPEYDMFTTRLGTSEYPDKILLAVVWHVVYPYQEE